MTTILIDSNRNAYNKAFLFEKPDEIIETGNPEDIENTILRLSHAVECGKYAAGFFSYELGYLMEPRLAERLPKQRHTPLLWFAIYDKAEQLDQKEVYNFLNNRIPDTKDHTGISNIQLSETRESYWNIFNQAQEYIASGDIYQLNLTFNAHFSFSGNPYKLYADLKQKQKMQHGAIIDHDHFKILSASPELFLTIDGQSASSGPMKGTAKRGTTLEHDLEIKQQLYLDEKSRAENLMILDLMRNDLGRISKIGSVNVSDLYAIETYPTLHQMVSWVNSKLEENITLSDWLKALHPPGSITGAPKVRAMEIINDLETEERGAYTGAIGMICPADRHQKQTYFNVGIRTLTLWPDGTGQMGIGSGVVSDSNADDEYDECILKMKFLTDPVQEFDLIETFAYTPEEGYLYYTHHLQRLQKSAEYFNFSFNKEAIEKALANKAAELKSGCYRVRMLLSENGALSITETPVDAPNPEGTMSFVISDKKMDRNNIYLYHKTTNRDFYDNEHAQQTKIHNCDEIIFTNEEGELTEGSRTNIFVEQNGILYTPAIQSGLLPGTLRADLLDTGKAREKILTIEDLKTADNIYIGNSVRGLLKGVWKI